MADQVSMKLQGGDRVFRHMRAMPRAVAEEWDKAGEKSATEVAALASHLAPKRTGQYAASIQAKRISSERGPAWGVFASWVWRFIEFGTLNATARPHLWPALRLLKKRVRNRYKRATSKGVKRALGK